MQPQPDAPLQGTMQPQPDEPLRGTMQPQPETPLRGTMQPQPETPEPAQLERAQGACDRYVKDLEHPAENTFDHVLQEIHKPAPPQLVQGVLARLRAIRKRYYSDGEKTLQSCIHNLSAVGGPPLLHVLTAAYVVNGGVLLKHTQGHEEAVTDLLVDKQLEAPPETSTVASGRRVLERASELTDASDRGELERASELTDVPSTSIIVRRERTRSIVVEEAWAELERTEGSTAEDDELERIKRASEKLEEMKAETEECEDAAKELEDFLHTLEIEEGI